jgi:hypothetical protein
VPCALELNTPAAFLAYVTENAMPVPTFGHYRKIFKPLNLKLFIVKFLVVGKFQVTRIVSVCDQTVMQLATGV